MSLVCQDEDPNIQKETKVSEEATLPILNNMIGQVGVWLKHLQFPHKWRATQSQVLSRFLRRYNRVLNTMERPCHGFEDCNATCQNDVEFVGAVYGYCCSECEDELDIMF